MSEKELGNVTPFPAASVQNPDPARDPRENPVEDFYRASVFLDMLAGDYTIMDLLQGLEKQRIKNPEASIPELFKSLEESSRTEGYLCWRTYEDFIDETEDRIKEILPMIESYLEDDFEEDDIEYDCIPVMRPMWAHRRNNAFPRADAKTVLGFSVDPLRLAIVCQYYDDDEILHTRIAPYETIEDLVATLEDILSDVEAMDAFLDMDTVDVSWNPGYISLGPHCELAIAGDNDDYDDDEFEFVSPDEIEARRAEIAPVAKVIFEKNLSEEFSDFEEFLGIGPDEKTIFVNAMTGKLDEGVYFLFYVDIARTTYNFIIADVDGGCGHVFAVEAEWDEIVEIVSAATLEWVREEVEDLLSEAEEDAVIEFNDVDDISERTEMKRLYEERLPIVRPIIEEIQRRFPEPDFDLEELGLQSFFDTCSNEDTTMVHVLSGRFKDKTPFMAMANIGATPGNYQILIPGETTIKLLCADLPWEELLEHISKTTPEFVQKEYEDFNAEISGEEDFVEDEKE